MPVSPEVHTYLTARPTTMRSHQLGPTFQGSIMIALECGRQQIAYYALSLSRKSFHTLRHPLTGFRATPRCLIDDGLSRVPESSQLTWPCPLMIAASRFLRKVRRVLVNGFRFMGVRFGSILRRVLRDARRLATSFFANSSCGHLRPTPPLTPALSQIRPQTPPPVHLLARITSIS